VTQNQNVFTEPGLVFHIVYAIPPFERNFFQQADLFSSDNVM